MYSFSCWYLIRFGGVKAVQACFTYDSLRSYRWAMGRAFIRYISARKDRPVVAITRFHQANFRSLKRFYTAKYVAYRIPERQASTVRGKGVGQIKADKQIDRSKPNDRPPLAQNAFLPVSSGHGSRTHASPLADRNRDCNPAL